jgi:hypothetical protein
VVLFPARDKEWGKGKLRLKTGKDQKALDLQPRFKMRDQIGLY